MALWHAVTARRAAARSSLATATAAGSHCQACGTAEPGTIAGCSCGGGICAGCGADTCACPWSEAGPAPPARGGGGDAAHDAMGTATRALSERAWGYIDVPLTLADAASILVVGEYSGACAIACRARFPDRIVITVDHRPGEQIAGGLHYCGDVRDVLWRRRWWLLIGHPPCAAASLSNTTEQLERVDSGDVWRAMSFALMLYCAPAETAIIEQPPTKFAPAYRPPNQKVQFLEFKVGYSKEWWLWHRGAVGALTPTGRAAAQSAAPHRIRCGDKDEREKLRSETPPEMARALLSAVGAKGGGQNGPPPLFAHEVRRLGVGFYRLYGGRGIPSDWTSETAAATGAGVPHPELGSGYDSAPATEAPAEPAPQQKQAPLAAAAAAATTSAWLECPHGATRLHGQSTSITASFPEHAACQRPECVADAEAWAAANEPPEACRQQGGGATRGAPFTHATTAPATPVTTSARRRRMAHADHAPNPERLAKRQLALARAGEGTAAAAHSPQPTPEATAATSARSDNAGACNPSSAAATSQEARSAAPAADDGTPTISLAAPTARGDTAVALVPTRIEPAGDARGPGEPAARSRLSALIPLRGGADVVGATAPKGTRRGRREGMVETAAKWMPALALPSVTYFLAGEVATHDSQPEAAGLVVVTVPVPPSAPAAQAHPTACSAAEITAARDAGHSYAWATAGALAEAAQCSATTARYRAAATAIAKVESYLRPTPDGPVFMRVGARAEQRANLSASAQPAGKVTLAERCRRTAAEAAEFQRLLYAVPASDDDGGWSAFCHSLAPGVDTNPADKLPPELADYELPEGPADLLSRAFQHIAIVRKSAALPPPEAQTPPPDGWWPHDITDIVEERALEEIEAWLVKYRAWHRAGGPAASRPAAAAWGPEDIKPKARGRRWDLRKGPGQIELFNPLTEPKRTCINLEYAATLLATCDDQELLSMIVGGVNMKAETMAQQIVLMPNLLSMYTANGGVAAAAKQMDAMVAEGFMGLFDALPCVPFRAVPRGEVPKRGTDELRGIADQGQPRKRLRTKRGGDPVESLNELSRAADWPHQDMDNLESAALNGAICQALADLNGESSVEMAFDFSKYFHRLFYEALSLYQMGCIVPRLDDPEVLSMALEYVMSMGATPSSLIAQKFSNAMLQQMCERMHAEEAARWRDPSLPDELTPAARAALEARAQLEPSCYGTAAAMFSMLMYCDDCRAVCAGAARAMRLLRIFHDIVGPAGLRVPLSRASKQQTGCCVTWLGACLASGLGLVWLPPEKAVRAAAGISATLRGDMEVGEYRSLVGFLVSLLFMVGGDKRLLHHIFRPINPGEEIDGGPATPVICDDCMRPVLERWLALVMDTPGTATVAAAAPTAPPTDAVKHRIRVDAALRGTPRPGIGGWLYGLWFAVAIADWPGLERLDIPHLEFLAACVGVLTFEPMLAGAAHVCLETDALATATSLTNRARSPAMQAILDALLEAPEYRVLAKRLTCSHCWGSGNPLGDAASRGYDDTMREVSHALGMPASRIPISAAAEAFLHRALSSLAGLVGAAEQPNVGATALGPANVSMDGRWIAPYGAPVPRDDMDCDGSPGPAVPATARSSAAALLDDMGSPTPAATPPPAASQARRQRPQYAEYSPARYDKRPTPTASRVRERDMPSGSLSPAAPPGGEKRNASRAGLRTPAAPPDSMAEATPPPRSRQAKQPRAALFSDGDVMAEARAGQTVARTEADEELPSLSPPPHAPSQPGDRKASKGAEAMRASRVEASAELLQMLRGDTSEHAIQGELHKLEWLCDVSTVGHGEEMPLTTQAQRASNWRAWERYIKWLSPTLNPWRPDINTLDPVGVRRECAIWAGALSWIYARMKPAKGRFLPVGPPHFGRPKPPSPQSALAILRGARAEHIARGITPPPMKLATLRCHELMLKYMREVGPENCTPQRKAPLTHLIITSLLAIKEDAPLLAGGKTWSWQSEYGHSTRTLLHVLAQTGFRKAEVALSLGKWDASRISFANLKWKIDGKTVLYPTWQQLMTLKEGDYAILMPPPSKADQFGMRWGNNPIWLPFNAIDAVNAARALSRWELCARVKPDARRATPLFCGEEGVGSPLKASALDTLFKRMLEWIGVDASLYSIHSFRSYLASAMMAADCTDAQIQAALRWASEDALKVYKVANREAYGSWLTRAEKVKLTGERARSLHATHRHLPMFEMEELAGAFTTAQQQLGRAAAAADSGDPDAIAAGGVECVMVTDAEMRLGDGSRGVDLD